MSELKRIKEIKASIDSSFTTKEEYLQFKRNWKAGYKEISHLIRELKKKRRAEPEDWQHYSHCHYARVNAREMMEMLEYAKEIARQQKAKVAEMAA